MKKYNLINNALGWLCFVIAAVTYLLTIEPTASFWDCPEFISQGAKLEVGHPPGNPIFMLTARFFVTIFGGIQNAAIAVNSMSALLSAATILLLFWTITHLAKKIIVKDDAQEVTLFQMLVIMGAGLCGALAYTWSDTFWFSAVEGEVYAFSSLCTALVFWLILKWENRADQPHSDRYLVLIAYVIGVSIAVHLLNLLCIPAIVLVYYYRKHKDANATGSLIALGVSFVIVAAILYGLVPGYIKVAQGFELFCVNELGWGYNMGVLAYAIVLVAVFIWAIIANYRGKNPAMMKGSVLAVAVLSGLTFISDNGWIWLGLFVVFAGYLFFFCNKVPQRVFNVAVLSVFVIFVGYSSYALLLIRATANTPMNQNAPDNVFSLASYLNREQYGQRPLFMGPVFGETVNAYRGDNGNIEYIQVNKNGLPATTALGLSDALYYRLTTDELGNQSYLPIDNGKKGWSKVAKSNPNEPDQYVDNLWTPDYVYSPDLYMPFTRIYSLDPKDVAGYKGWIGYRNPDFDNVMLAPAALRSQWAESGWAPFYQIAPYLNNLSYVSLFEDSHDYEKIPVWKATFADNFRYFMNYQLNHMYWRYFMWNFAGRQNDYQSNGEPNLGNWISGIPFIDNARLGDQSLLPKEYTTGNKGHNVFYMLPLILGLLGIIWQALSSHPNNPKRGIEQFWVVFFLFFMTGIAIVLYLNQTPGQPRERDYAFAGSFYAFAIWIGLGVPAIARYIADFFAWLKKKKFEEAGKDVLLPAAGVACAIGLFVPIQMVSQTWDDHDRSHRYTTRDFGANYLNSLEPDAIIFTNGDNDTFPLWYSQEVEGLRTDVRVVNLSYLSTDWYANQQLHPYYDAKAIPMLAKATDYAYDKLGYSRNAKVTSDSVVDALDGLRQFYANPTAGLATPLMESHVGRNTDAYGTDDKAFAMMSPETRDSLATWMVIKRFGLNPNSSDSVNVIPYIAPIEMKGLVGGFGLSKLLSFDMIANSIANNFDRPVYFASTVPNSYYLGLEPNLYSTGVAQMVTPFRNAPVSPMAVKTYENIVSKYRWGGLDDVKHNKDLYLDETVRRMVSTMRNSIIETAEALAALGDEPASAFAVQWAKDNNLPVPQNRYDMARYLIELMEEKMPDYVSPYESLTDFQVAALYLDLYAMTGNKSDLDHAERVIDTSLERYARLTNYAASLSAGQLGLMGNTDLYMLQYVPVLIEYKNYIDLQRALDGKAVDPALMALVNDALPLTMASNVSAFVYLQDETTADDIDAEIDEYGEAWGPILRSTSALMRLNEQAGLHPADYARQLMAKYGTNLDDVNRFSGN
ncbi:MAG: DUF2723 domain-containing protein [Bacteroidales bacterium]|nr:DUF2723 domain-containing protein [Bacteroidales bacterium]